MLYLKVVREYFIKKNFTKLLNCFYIFYLQNSSSINHAIGSVFLNAGLGKVNWLVAYCFDLFHRSTCWKPGQCDIRSLQGRGKVHFNL